MIKNNGFNLKSNENSTIYNKFYNYVQYTLQIKYFIISFANFLLPSKI